MIEQVEVPPNHGHKLNFDNNFSSLCLLSHLANKKYCASRKIRELEQCLVSNKTIWNKAQSGSYNFIFNNNSLLVQWKDNKVVYIASNFEGVDAVNTSCWDRVSKSKRNISQPKTISSYNKHMGEVDKLDSLVDVYTRSIRQRKWYWPLVAYLHDVSVVNGCILMKNMKPNMSDAESLIHWIELFKIFWITTVSMTNTTSNN